MVKISNSCLPLYFVLPELSNISITFSSLVRNMSCFLQSFTDPLIHFVDSVLVTRASQDSSSSPAALAEVGQDEEERDRRSSTSWRRTTIILERNVVQKWNLLAYHCARPLQHKSIHSDLFSSMSHFQQDSLGMRRRREVEEHTIFTISRLKMLLKEK